MSGPAVKKVMTKSSRLSVKASNAGELLARPRTEGLWLRLTFRSGEVMEGLAPTDQTLLDGLIEDSGLFLTPPDTRSNTQRLWIPASSMTELEIVAVIGGAPKANNNMVFTGMRYYIP